MQILAFVLFLIVMQYGWASRCNKAADSDGTQSCKDSGPGGFEKCIQLGNYSSYQCASCLRSDDQQRKNGHNCTSLSSNQYCWYPCMLENHNQTSGQVAKNCSCDAPVTTTVVTVTVTPTSSADSPNCGPYGVFTVSIILMNIFAAFPY
ncbi:hypothetical protein OS493_037379 [Desmophyllum pertusum]|uniref:Uncharacterized protein n=1 Tax=Desmophyllum pertusum TaxID=174260 RepID=A0A9X0D870_9CNID|nr:hypothetical protein OS493_037379 [Desmophyllum pertusum]